MKKFSLILAFMLCVSVTTFASNAKCLLHHNGTVTLFDADDLNSALNAAVDGDTIYLSDGNFAGFTITKKITVRGSGQMTRIGGDINIEIPNTPTLTNTLLEGFYSGADIVLKAAVNGLKIKQCRFRSIYSDFDINDVVLDRVYITNLYLSTHWLGLNCLNSKISQVITYNASSFCNGVSSTASIYFINCNIEYIGNSYGQGDYLSVINSVVRSIQLRESNITNCLYGGYLGGINIDASTTVVTSCYDSGLEYPNSLLKSELECYFDASTLQSKGFMGQDGTVVGCYGGTNPYSLDLVGPKVTESSISIDNDTKQLSVTLKVSAK